MSCDVALKHEGRLEGAILVILLVCVDCVRMIFRDLIKSGVVGAKKSRDLPESRLQVKLDFKSCHLYLASGSNNGSIDKEPAGCSMYVTCHELLHADLTYQCLVEHSPPHAVGRQSTAIHISLHKPGLARRQTSLDKRSCHSRDRQHAVIQYEVSRLNLSNLSINHQASSTFRTRQKSSILLCRGAAL